MRLIDTRQPLSDFGIWANLREELLLVEAWERMTYGGLDRRIADGPIDFEHFGYPPGCDYRGTWTLHVAN